MNLKKNAAMLLLAACASAHAFDSIYEALIADLGGWYSAEQLYRFGVGNGIFLGYIAATADSASTASEFVGPICIPPATRLGQLADVVYKYMRDNPARRHLSGIFIIREAIRDSWPCPKK